MRHHRNKRLENRRLRERARRAMQRDEFARKERESRDALKRKMMQYLGDACTRCELTPEQAGHVACFDFHHRNPAEKSFHFAGNYRRRWEVIQAELDKCVLLCANCHRFVEATSERCDRRRGRPPISLPPDGHGGC